MTDVLDLAKYLLYLNKEEAEQAGDEAVSDIDPMKLQKLLYYCQGYSLGITGRVLFEDKIEAWKYGPVVRTVYKEYQNYKGSWIPLDLVVSPPPMDDYVSHIAKLVMRDKGKYSATALMKMTHKEPAWKEAWEKGLEEHGYQQFADYPISIETMKGYFIDELDDEELPEEEDEFWNFAGRKPTEEEWSFISNWASNGCPV
ncbi:MAG: DUF4065 domain-containing protein [Synergistaceae bacterium]|jgi:uncharacterized phage-associated protein|nr:DUF4065 domain-containing protein [Synergistaceae bacterium]